MSYYGQIPIISRIVYRAFLVSAPDFVESMMGFPKQLTTPEVASNIPVSMEIDVVFPAPL